jgi:hypothetical protein
MRNKIYDQDYAGCNVDRIRNTTSIRIDTNVFQILAHWIKERYLIHLKKDVLHMSSPWTDDEILNQYRFTNVRREHDKETRWLIEHVCSVQDLSPTDKLLNIVLFRMINKSQTVQGFMPIRDFKNPKEIEHACQVLRSFPQDYNLFTGVFMTSGMQKYCNRAVGKSDNTAISCLIYCANQVYDSIVDALQKTYAVDFFVKINSISGIGRFLAYQIFVDWTYCPESLFSENCFVVAGPGAIRGLSYLFTDNGGLTPEEQLFWLRDNWDKLLEWLNIDWTPDKLLIDLPMEDRFMNVMSLQNCMCELSKYMKTLLGTGRPRARYNPGGNKDDKQRKDA